MTPIQTLTAARELLSEPDRWTKDALARTRSAKTIGPNEVNAVCWCMIGAIRNVANNETSAVWRAVACVEAALGGVTLFRFNDDPATTHEMVIAAFDAAIEKARADG